MKKVSILMNAYNSELYLKESIESIYKQTYSNWEILFIDNCSNDRTPEIVKLFDSRLRYFKTKKKLPLGAARNFGLKHVKGDFLAFLDTDDIWIQDKLEKQLKCFDSSIAFVYSPVYHIDVNSNIIYRTSLNKKQNIKSLFERYDINMHSAMINLDLIKVKFNDGLTYCPDYELFINIVAAGYNFKIINEPLVKYRIHNESLSNNLEEIKFLEIDNVLKSIELKFPDLYRENLKSIKKGRFKTFQLIQMKINFKRQNYFKASLNLFNLSIYNYKYLIFALLILLPKVNLKVAKFLNRIG